MSHIISNETKDFFAASSPAQLEAMRAYIIELQAQQTALPSTQYVHSPMRKKPKTAAASRSKARKKSVQPPGLTLAAKRPLNSWMAFRAYYSPIFATYQQKDISGFLTGMWQADPFHAKWTIAAKAYSAIRDKVGKAHAPLDTFLHIVCPLLGIVSGVEYLTKLGWILNEERTLTRFWVPTLMDFDAHERATTMSVDDVVTYCQDVGYVEEAVQPTTMTNNAAMMMAAEPSAAETTTPAFVAASDGPVAAETNSTEYVLTPDGGFIANNAEYELDPSVAYEANNVLLATSEDSYPYNFQFDSADAVAGFGLDFNPNQGDEFNAIDTTQIFDFDHFFNNQYDTAASQFFNGV